MEKGERAKYTSLLLDADFRRWHGNVARDSLVTADVYLSARAYSALHAVLRNYANDRIGFFGTNKVFKFGGERLTKGVEHLFDLCKDCIVYDNYTIGDVLNQIKESKADFGRIAKGIKDEVAKRQIQIGYWDYVPIP